MFHMCSIDLIKVLTEIKYFTNELFATEKSKDITSSSLKLALSVVQKIFGNQDKAYVDKVRLEILQNLQWILTPF